LIQRTMSAVLALACLALVGYGVVVVMTATPASPPPSATAVSACAGGGAAQCRPGTPVSLRIETLGIDAPVTPTRVTKGALQVPDNIQLVGWDRSTVRPGSLHGTTLFAGHRDNVQGQHGALWQVAKLHRRDRVVVSVAGGRSLTYVVTRVAEYLKTGLPDSIISRHGRHRLAIVTCGGPLVRGSDGLLHYRDNVVAWATPLS